VLNGPSSTTNWEMERANERRSEKKWKRGGERVREGRMKDEKINFITIDIV